MATPAPGLEATWKDRERQRESSPEAFEQTMKVSGDFVQESELHASGLNKKAAAVEEYLRQR